MKRTSNLRVAIIGAGVAGASAAVALKAKGIRAEVYEQAPELKEVGAGIGLRSPSIECFKKWNIFDDMDKVTSRSDYNTVVSGKGEVLIREQWPVLTEDPHNRWTMFVHRADLLETLVKQLPKDSVHLDHRVTKIVEHDDHVEIEFENGNKVQADVVVAADGIRSTVRTKIFGENHVNYVYSSYHAYRAIVSYEEAEGVFSHDNELRIYVEGPVNIYMLPLEHRQQVSVDITAPSPDRNWSPEVTVDEILAHLTALDPKFSEIVRNLGMENINCRALHDIDPIHQWSTKRITLMGDAAHSMLHNQGQGANMAIQDADVFADVLVESASIEEALKKYEELRKPVTHKYQELSRSFHEQNEATVFPEKQYFEKKVN